MEDEYIQFLPLNLRLVYYAKESEKVGTSWGDCPILKHALWAFKMSTTLKMRLHYSIYILLIF